MEQDYELLSQKLPPSFAVVDSPNSCRLFNTFTLILSYLIDFKVAFILKQDA
jgi:hypothetical protein